MKVLHVLLLILCDVSVTVLAQCPKRNASAAQAEDQTRSCRKSCKDDPNACAGSQETCNCDNLCGMSCFDPNALCPNISLPNGKITYSNGNSYNSEATHQCDPGYYFTGQKTRKCRSNKEWSHSNNIPNCENLSDKPTGGTGATTSTTTTTDKPLSDTVKYLIIGLVVAFSCIGVIILLIVCCTRQRKARKKRKREASYTPATEAQPVKEEIANDPI